MKQSEFNQILEASAAMLADLPPVFDDPWWGGANLSTRQYLVIEAMDAHESLAKDFGLAFSRARFAKSALPSADAAELKMVSRKDYELFNGVWVRKGVDPYACGMARGFASMSGSKSAGIADGCLLAAGLVTR